MSTEITRQSIRYFLKRYEHYKGEDLCMFTKKGLWHIQKSCWDNDMEYYWDYNDSFSDDQVEKILEGNLDTYNEICVEIEENCYDTASEMKRYFVSEIEIKPHHLTKEYREHIMQEHDCEEDELVELAREDLDGFIREYFMDDLYVSFDFEKLLKNTRGAIYVEADDIGYYEQFNIATLNHEALLFSTIAHSFTQREEELFAEEFGSDYTCLDDLEGHETLTICIADSLSEYLDTLVEKEQGEDVEKHEVVKWCGNYIPDASINTPFLSSSDESDADASIEMLTKEEYKMLVPDPIDFDIFKERLREAHIAYAKEYLEKHKGVGILRDQHGRNLAHYAVVAGSFDTLKARRYNKSQNYEMDNMGVSPYLLAISILDEETGYTQEHIDFVKYLLNVTYKDILEKTPGENTTAQQWGALCKLKGTIGDTEYFVIEVQNNTYSNLPDITVFALQLDPDGGRGFFHVELSSFDNLIPIDFKYIYLDGTIGDKAA